MLSALKQLKEWVTLLMGDINYPNLSEDNNHWQYFNNWLLNNRDSFKGQPEEIQEYLEKVYSAFLQGSYLMANKTSHSNSSSSFLGALDKVFTTGGNMAAVYQMNKMRKLIPTLLEIEVDYVRKLLLENGIDSVFSYLESDLSGCDNTELKNSFYIIKQRYSDLKVMQMRGVVSHDNATLEMNRIHESILRFINN